jgi:hypothetical protein
MLTRTWSASMMPKTCTSLPWRFYPMAGRKHNAAERRVLATPYGNCCAAGAKDKICIAGFSRPDHSIDKKEGFSDASNQTSRS